MRVVPVPGKWGQVDLIETSPLFPRTASCFFLLLLGTVGYDIYLMIVWRPVSNC